MKISAVVKSLFVASVLFAAPAVTHAGLFGLNKDESQVVPPLAPAPFDFDAAEKEPAKLVQTMLDLDTTGSGIRKLKKVAIAAFQVRFRKDMGNDVISAKGEGFTVDSQLLDDKNLYQQVTDEAFERFAKDLTALGLEVVDINVLAGQDGYKRGREKAGENGRVVKFSTAVGVGKRDLDSSDNKKSLFSVLSGATSGLEYYVHYATKAPEVIYPHGMSSDATGTMGSAEERIAEPGAISPALIESASKAGVGLLFVGYEVRMGKYSFENSTIDAGAFNTTHLAIHITPMMRVQLLSLKATPEGATSPSLYHGDRTLRASDGILIEPRPATERKGLIGSKKFYPWIETDGGNPWELVAIGQDQNKIITLAPNARAFAPAFLKCTDAYRHVLIAAIREEMNK